MCDNCPDTSNPDQADCDDDGVGDSCEEINVGKVIEVSFAGGNEIWTDPDGAVPAERVVAPQYRDADADGQPERTWPLVYTRAGGEAMSQVTISQVKIKVDAGCAVPELSVEGKLSDPATGLDLTFTSQGTVTDGLLTVNGLETQGTLPGTVQAYLNKAITWKVIRDGEEYPAGMSTNRLYVTLGDAKLQNLIEDKGPS